MPTDADDPGATTFTAREVEIIRHLATGQTYDEIGPELGISPRTVKAYADRLRLKLGVRHRRLIPTAYARATGRNPFPEAPLVALLGLPNLVDALQCALDYLPI